MEKKRAHNARLAREESDAYPSNRQNRPSFLEGLLRGNRDDESDDGFDESDNNGNKCNSLGKRGQRHPNIKVSNVESNNGIVGNGQVSFKTSAASNTTLQTSYAYTSTCLEMSEASKCEKSCCDNTSGSVASQKREAWKNALNTAAEVSERDSLLTNSVDERSAASFDSRSCHRLNKDSITRRDTGQSSLDRERNNTLTVPSPGGRRSGFYSTSPSTDEGIVTDDVHVTEEIARKSPKEKSKSEETEISKPVMETAARITSNATSTSPVEVKPNNTAVTESRSQASLHKKAYLVAQQRQRYGNHNERYFYQGSIIQEQNNNCYRQPPDNLRRQPISHGPISSSGRLPRKVANENGNYAIYEDDRSWRKRHLYQRRGQSYSDTPEFYQVPGENFNFNTEETKNMRRNKQIWRQQSEQYPHTQPPSLRYANDSWNSASNCCEVIDREQDDGPIVLYSRSPNEIRSNETKLPALFERRESEVIACKGSHVSRIVAKDSERRNSSSETYTNESSSTASNNSTPSTVRENRSRRIPDKTSPELALQLKPGFTDLASCSRNQPESTNSNRASPAESFGLSSIGSPTTVSGRETPLTTATMKTHSRTGSTRSSALVEALSSVVVATATGSVMPEGSHLTSKEKQKSLTERLMTVGPSDPRRVQGIVEDILCEMGEERIIQYKDAFAKFDKDSSGIISSKQLRTLLRTLGHNPSDSELRELINQVDMDENGKIDFNEFIIMIGYFDKANNENEDLVNIFRVYDREDKGCIDVDELRNIWNDFLRELAPDDTFEEMIRVIDNDGNGEINRVELLELLSTR